SGGLVAVGFATDPASGETSALAMVSSDGGNHWQILTIPKDNVSSYRLFAVAAIDATHIWFAGDVASPQKFSQALIFFYDGQVVTRVATPVDNQATVRNNSLAGLTCAANGACWAVGNGSSGNIPSPLAMKLTPNTKTWTVVPAAATPANGSIEQFKGVVI